MFYTSPLNHCEQAKEEIKDVIEEVDENASKTTGSKERSTNGLFQYNPVEMNKAFKRLFGDKNWTESWVAMSPPHQRDEIEQVSSSAIFGYNQTDFVKDRVAIEVHFGKYSFVAYDLFVKQLAFYMGEKIDVGIEILPMKQLQSHQSFIERLLALRQGFPAGSRFMLLAFDYTYDESGRRRPDLSAFNTPNE